MASSQFFGTKLFGVSSAHKNSNEEDLSSDFRQVNEQSKDFKFKIEL